MDCGYCGAAMRQVGRSRTSGYPLWKCPNAPHKKCPNCKKMLYEYYRNLKDPVECLYCHSKVARKDAK